MPQVPAVGDAVHVGDPYVPIMTVRRVMWVAEGVPEGTRVGESDYQIDCDWHAEAWLDRGSA